VAKKMRFPSKLGKKKIVLHGNVNDIAKKKEWIYELMIIIVDNNIIVKINADSFIYCLIQSLVSIYLTHEDYTFSSPMEKFCCL